MWNDRPRPPHGLKHPPAVSTVRISVQISRAPTGGSVAEFNLMWTVGLWSFHTASVISLPLRTKLEESVRDTA
jgi:hypothetical protein